MSESQGRVDVSVASGIVTIGMCDVYGRNALSGPFVEELLAALLAVGRMADSRVVVLFGLSDVFCAGANLDVLEKVVAGEVVPGDHLLSKALLDMPVPTIAAMEGHAIGGGLALGLCADISIIARESRYGCSFMNMGFTPGMGSTRLLENVLSPAIAHELLYSGERRRGADFEGRSGFNHILPRADVRSKAYEIAERIADKPRVALEALKRVLSADKRRAFEETRATETLMHAVSFGEGDIRQRIKDNYGQ